MNKEDLIYDRVVRVEEKVDLLVREVAGLKVKSGVWGAIAGIIPVVIVIVVWMIGR